MIYEDWGSYERTETAGENRLKVLEIPLAEGSQIRHTSSTIKSRKLNLTFWARVGRSALNSMVCSIGWRPLSMRIPFWISLTSQTMARGKDLVWQRLRPRNALSKLTSNSRPKYPDNKRDLLRWFRISAEKNIYKQLTVKFIESASEMFIKKVIQDIGEGRFREFDISLGGNTR
jgi:hypothetical protein